MSSSPTEPATTGVDHVVLIKVKDGTSKDQIEKFESGIESLQTIPGVVSVTVGSIFVEDWMADRTGGFTHALRTRLESKEALRVYQDHELHNQVKAEYIAPIAEKVLAVDWESPLTLGTPAK